MIIVLCTEMKQKIEQNILENIFCNISKFFTAPHLYSNFFSNIGEVNFIIATFMLLLFQLSKLLKSVLTVYCLFLLFTFNPVYLTTHNDLQY